MYPTGQTIGINSVENTFFRGAKHFFFFDISRNNLFILSKVENILFILSKMKKILFIFKFSSTPPPVIKWSAPRSATDRRPGLSSESAGSDTQKVSNHQSYTL